MSTHTTWHIHWQRPLGVYSTEQHWRIFIYIYIYLYTHIHINTRDMTHSLALQHETRLICCTATRGIDSLAGRAYCSSIQWQIHWHCNVRHDPFIALQHVVVIHIYICIYISTHTTWLKCCHCNMRHGPFTALQHAAVQLIRRAALLRVTAQFWVTSTHS